MARKDNDLNSKNSKRSYIADKGAGMSHRDNGKKVGPSTAI